MRGRGINKKRTCITNIYYSISHTYIRPRFRLWPRFFPFGGQLPIDPTTSTAASTPQPIVSLCRQQQPSSAGGDPSSMARFLMCRDEHRTAAESPALEVTGCPLAFTRRPSSPPLLTTSAAHRDEDKLKMSDDGRVAVTETRSWIISGGGTWSKSRSQDLPTKKTKKFNRRWLFFQLAYR
jgi:hypothetical protein